MTERRLSKFTILLDPGLNAIKVYQGALSLPLIDSEDSFDVDRGATEDGLVNLGVCEAGIAAGADLHGLAAHIEVLADGIRRRVLQKRGLELRHGLAGVCGTGIEYTGIQIIPEAFLGHSPGCNAPRLVREENPVVVVLLVLVLIHIDKAEDLVA